MAGIGIKVVETKARVVPKAAVLWLYDDPKRESDVSSLSLKCLFEEEVLKHVKEFDPKNPPVSVSPSNIVLNDKTYIGKWTEKGSMSFHRCKVLKISEKTSELNKFVSQNTKNEKAQGIPLSGKRKCTATRRVIEMEEIDTREKQKGKEQKQEKENHQPKQKKSKTEINDNETGSTSKKKTSAPKQSLKLAKLMTEKSINSELLNKWISKEGKENQQTGSQQIQSQQGKTDFKNNSTERTNTNITNVSFSPNSSSNSSINSPQVRAESSPMSPTYPPQAIAPLPCSTSSFQQQHTSSILAIEHSKRDKTLEHQSTIPLPPSKAQSNQFHTSSHYASKNPGSLMERFDPAVHNIQHPMNNSCQPVQNKVNTSQPVLPSSHQHHPVNITQQQYLWHPKTHHPALHNLAHQSHLNYLLDDDAPVLKESESLPGGSTQTFGSLFKNTTDLLINNKDKAVDNSYEDVNKYANGDTNEMDVGGVSDEGSAINDQSAYPKGCQRCLELEKELELLRQKISSLEQDAATSKHQVSIAINALSTLKNSAYNSGSTESQRKLHSSAASLNSSNPVVELQPCHTSSPVSAVKITNWHDQNEETNELVKGMGVLITKKKLFTVRKASKEYTDWSKCLHALLDIYFTPEVMAMSCATGNGLSSKPPLDPEIFEAIKVFLLLKFPNPALGCTEREIIRKTNVKCGGYRRPLKKERNDN